MGTLYIDRRDLRVKLDGNALAFYHNGTREGLVPINPIKRVIIVGNITLEATVLHRLAEEGIATLFLSGRGLAYRASLHGRLHQNGILRLKQYENFSSRGAVDAMRDLVCRKVESQALFLEESLDSLPAIRFFAREALDTIRPLHEKAFTVSAGESDESDEIRGYLTGLEGAASAAYFRAFTHFFPPSLKFTNRNRRPPRDPVNALLSLSYTLLHYEMVREIETIGLDPTIGFFHTFEYGRESLACDMVELFRTETDRFVYHLFKERLFTDRDFHATTPGEGCYLSQGGRKRFYPLYEEFAKGARKNYAKEVRNLGRRLLDGQDPVPD